MSCIIDIYILQFPAADIARECRQFSKQDNERSSASLMKLKEIRSENAAQTSGKNWPISQRRNN